jgi:Flp pilus assembly pilin Flp
MKLVSTYSMALDYLRTSLVSHYAKAKSRAEDGERGASAVEWVVITAVVVIIIVFVSVLLVNVLEAKATQACTSINTAGGTGGAGASCSGS